MSEKAVPLIERGDIVRLKEPYRVNPEDLLPAVFANMQIVAYHRGGHAHAHVDEPADIVPYRMRDDPNIPNLHEFTHGVVANITGRYSPGFIESAEAIEVDYTVGQGPPRNVELLLFNPDTGFTYFDRGAGDRGVPMYVQFHVTHPGLVLIQKHDEMYEHHEWDMADIYDRMGVVDIVDAFTGGDDDG